MHGVIIDETNISELEYLHSQNIIRFIYIINMFRYSNMSRTINICFI